MYFIVENQTYETIIGVNNCSLLFEASFFINGITVLY